MGDVHNIPASVKLDIARQVGEQLALLDPEAVAGKRVELHEDFAVWGLKEGSIENIVEGIEENFSKLAAPTDRWHHQIVANDRPIAFARSIPQPRTSLRKVVDLFLSPVARNIEQAIEWAENNVDEEPEDARLLPIPAFYLHTLWIVEENKQDGNLLVVADGPREFRELRPRTIIKPADFAAAVRKAAPRRTPLIARRVARNIEERVLHTTSPVVRNGDLARVFNRWAFKRLSSHEVDPDTSHGHEFQGIARLMVVLGMPTGRQTRRVKVAYFTGDPEQPPKVQYGAMTWYNSREGKPRAAEFRLYYTANLSLIQSEARYNDLMVLASDFDDNLFMFIIAGASVVEQHVQYLFGTTTELGQSAKRSVAVTTSKVLTIASKPN